jgi:hypothetical protein
VQVSFLAIFLISPLGARDTRIRVISELRSYRNEVAATLTAIEKQNPDFVNAVIGQLLIKDPYIGVSKMALEKAKELLKAV